MQISELGRVHGEQNIRQNIRQYSAKHSTKKQKFRERNQIIRLEKSRYISRACPLFLKIPIQQKLKRPMLKDLEFSIVIEINIF